MVYVPSSLNLILMILHAGHSYCLHFSSHPIAQNLVCHQLDRNLSTDTLNYSDQMVYCYHLQKEKAFCPDQMSTSHLYDNRYFFANKIEEQFFLTSDQIFRL